MSIEWHCADEPDVVIERLQAQVEALRRALDDACTRMERAREILRWSNDRGPWGLLDTAALRAAVAAGR